MCLRSQARRHGSAMYIAAMQKCSASYTRRRILEQMNIARKFQRVKFGHRTYLVCHGNNAVSTLQVYLEIPALVQCVHVSKIQMIYKTTQFPYSRTGIAGIAGIAVQINGIASSWPRESMAPRGYRASWIHSL